MNTKHAPADTLQLSPFERRWLAEAVRHGEDRAGRVQEDAQAEARGRAAGSDLEERIIARALALPQAPDVAQAIAVHARMLRVAAVVSLLFALLAGMGAARVAFGDGGDVNFVQVLAALLGVQMLMLLLWLLASLLPATRGGALGRAVVSFGGWLSHRLSGGAGGAQAIAAARGVLDEHRLGRWLLGAMTHGIWFLYTLGALLASLLLLSVNQYDFHWATTILPDEFVVSLLDGLARLPAWLGFSVPDEALVRASRLGVADGTGRESWSALLLGSLVLFGLLPRGLLAIFCLAAARRATRRFRLDLTRPGYARLAPRLQPVAQPLGRLGTPDPAPRISATDFSEPLHVDGLVAMLGIELERPTQAWPPRIDGLDWIVLGRADDRMQRRDVLAALQGLPVRLGCLVVIVSLLRTPDRGTAAYLAQLKEAALAPMLLLLDEGGRLRQRGGDAGVRAANWRELAAGVGVDAVEELDLDRGEDHRLLRRRLGMAA